MQPRAHDGKELELVPTAMLLCRVFAILCLTVSASQSQGECRPIFCSVCVALWPRGARSIDNINEDPSFIFAQRDVASE